MTCTKPTWENNFVIFSGLKNIDIGNVLYDVAGPYIFARRHLIEVDHRLVMKSAQKKVHKPV